MSTTSKRLSLSAASALGAMIVAALRPGCQRIELAGSLRRKQETIGDIEIVAIPTAVGDLFGSLQGTRLDPILGELILAGKLVKEVGGDKYKRFRLPKHGCKLDLFLATAETFGSIFFIRTGPTDWSRRAVTPQSKGGMAPEGIKFHEGRVYRHGVLLDTPEEADIFAALGLKWVEPWERT